MRLKSYFAKVCKTLEVGRCDCCATGQTKDDVDVEVCRDWCGSNSQTKGTCCQWKKDEKNPTRGNCSLWTGSFKDLTHVTAWPTAAPGVPNPAQFISAAQCLIGKE